MRNDHQSARQQPPIERTRDNDQIGFQRRAHGGGAHGSCKGCRHSALRGGGTMNTANKIKTVASLSALLLVAVAGARSRQTKSAPSGSASRAWGPRSEALSLHRLAAAGQHGLRRFKCTLDEGEVPSAIRYATPDSIVELSLLRANAAESFRALDHWPETVT
jgi:hypothetical protein